MYEFVDRPVSSLNRGGQLLVSAMRRWVAAIGGGRCPCSELSPSFERADLTAGFPHFHVMMALLNGHAREQFRFCAVECPLITEHEALLLTVIRSAQDDIDRTRETARLFIREGAVTPLLVALAALSEALAGTDHWPMPPASDAESSHRSCRGEG